MSRCMTVAMAGRPIDDDCVAIANRNKRRYNFEGSNGEGLLQTISVRRRRIEWDAFSDVSSSIAPVRVTETLV